MGAYNKAHWASQRHKVLVHKEAIIDFLRTGVSLPEIQRRLGLEEMPYTTFYNHARKLRESSGVSMYDSDRIISRSQSVSDDRREPESPIEQVADTPTETLQPKAEKTKPPAQSKSVAPVKVIEEEPKKRAKRKRKGGGISPNLSVKEEEFDTSKWSSELK